MTKVKLCGMFRAEDIDAVAAAAPDYVGFIVDFPKSHRSVGADELIGLCRKLDALREGAPAGTCQKVGVFVDKPAGFVAETARTAKLECVQLHGHEDASYVEELRGLLPDGCTIIQAFRVACADDVTRAEESPADLILLDSGRGSGDTFDWSLVADARRSFLLAGGLGPENARAAIESVHPFGIDMSSGIETNKLKDPKKMAAAVAAVKGETA